MTRGRPSRACDTTRPGNGERGASAVEFALVMPVLMLFLFGLIGFGFVFAQQLSLNNAARDAARAGVVKTLNGSAQQCSDLVTVARNAAGTTIGVPSTTSIGVSISGPAGSCAAAAGSTTVTGAGASSTLCTGSTSGSQVTVTVSYASQPPVSVGGFSTINLSGTGKFQCEYTS